MSSIGSTDQTDFVYIRFFFLLRYRFIQQNSTGGSSQHIYNETERLLVSELNQIETRDG